MYEDDSSIFSLFIKRLLFEFSSVKTVPKYLKELNIL